MKATARIWGATRCISSEQKLFETEPSERSQTHHHTPHGFPDKQIKHSDCATTVTLIEFQISMTKAASKKKKKHKKKKKKKKKKTTTLHQQIGLTFKEETNKVLHLEYNFVWC
jgi:hypothetical protein